MGTSAVSPLAAREAHCWCVPLDRAPEELACSYAMLGSDERDRAIRLRFERDRRRFVIAHGVLRDLLGQYLDAEPRRLRFVRGPCGKPELSSEFGGGVKFNLSHSADFALIAIAAGTDIGVDLEQIRDGSPSEYAEIARSFFSAEEVEHLNRVPPHRYVSAFYECWTRKEAYVKARGDDLATTLDNATAPSSSWTFLTIHPAPGCIGTVAIEESGWRVVTRSFGRIQ